MADSLVWRYYAYRATVSAGFVTPVFTLFLLRTLTFAEVGALSAVTAVLVVAGEVPTGYVGDRFGRRVALLLSVGFAVASLLGFVLVASFAWYVVLYVLWALGLAFRSGSDDAWLYDALDERLTAERFTRVRGRGGAVTRWTSAVTMVAGGALYAADPRYPFVAAAALNALGALALLALPAADGGADGLAIRDALPLLREQFARPPLRSFVAFVALFFAVTGVANTYVQPAVVDALGAPAPSALLDRGASPVGDAAVAVAGHAVHVAFALGLLYAGFTVVAAVGAQYAGAAEDALGTRVTVLGVAGGVAVLLSLPRAVAVLTVPAFVAMRGGRAVLAPVASGYLNEHAASTGRATVLSAASTTYALGRVPLAVAAGALADATTARTTVAALALLFLLGGAAVALAERPVA